MPPVHRESHRALLLDRMNVGPSRPVDAVYVPAGRTARHLTSAAELALELDSALVALFSPGRADPREFEELARDRWPELTWHTVEVPDDYDLDILPTTAYPDPRYEDWRHGSLSILRNLAMVITRLCRWRTVLLLDDDIVDIDPLVVENATRHLHSAAAVGLSVADYPDNSVVCHANRLVGGQDVFVGACALLVDVSRPVGFFPSVYNEDWLFLYDRIAARQVARVGAARQLVYEPFGKVERARAEEFGEVLAEGMMAALHDRREDRPPTSVEYWESFIAARLTFIQDIATSLPATLPDGVDVAQVRQSLLAAEFRLGEITAVRCADFVVRWLDDLQRWHGDFAELPPLPSVEAALDYVGLSGSLTALIA